MAFGRILLWIASVMFAVFGLAYLLDPAGLVGPAGLSLPTPSALSDVRATYGGVQLGFGAFLAWSALAAERVPAGLLALALIEMGVSLCRAVGVVVDGDLNRFHVTALAIEVPLTLLAWIAFTRVRRSAEGGCP
jgi:hypothetical protein